MAFWVPTPSSRCTQGPLTGALLCSATHCSTAERLASDRLRRRGEEEERASQRKPQVRRRDARARPPAGRRRPIEQAVAPEKVIEPRAAPLVTSFDVAAVGATGFRRAFRWAVGMIRKGCRVRRRQTPRAWKSSWKKARTSRQGWWRASKTLMPIKARFAQAGSRG